MTSCRAVSEGLLSGRGPRETVFHTPPSAPGGGGPGGRGAGDELEGVGGEVPGRVAMQTAGSSLDWTRHWRHASSSASIVPEACSSFHSASWHPTSAPHCETMRRSTGENTGGHGVRVFGVRDPVVVVEPSGPGAPVLGRPGRGLPAVGMGRMRSPTLTSMRFTSVVLPPGLGDVAGGRGGRSLEASMHLLGSSPICVRQRTHTSGR
mmetsp:Transcript_98966/g.170413  ORF Transcript_98966/g.170413 Transcript_98966/m.170413 type:complete len:207 (+) Transcript_98966:703-1323(+)